MDFPTVQPVTRMKVAKTFNAQPAAQGPGIGPAGPDTGPPAGGAAPQGQRPGPGRPRGQAAARGDPRPLLRMPRPRGPRALGRAVRQARSGDGNSSPDRESTNTIARQFDRVCDVLGDLPRDRPRRAPRCRGSTASWTWWPRSACGRASGRTWSRPPWPRRCPPSCSRRATRTTPSRRGFPAAPCARRCRGWSRSGVTSTPSSASIASASCASRTLDSPGLPTGGPEALPWRTCSTTWTGPGDFVRWVNSCSTWESIADAAGDTPLRRTARDAVRAMRRSGGLLGRGRHLTLLMSPREVRRTPPMPR